MTDIVTEWGDLHTDMHAEKTTCEHEDSHLQAKELGSDPSLTALRKKTTFPIP